MEQQQYLIDTNVVIDYLGNKLLLAGMHFMNGVIDAIPNVSVVTKIEVLGFNTTDAHYTLLSNFMNDSTVLDLTNTVVDACIELRKKHRSKLPDAIIAATAVIYNLVLISRNSPDFKNIHGLSIIDPYRIV